MNRSTEEEFDIADYERQLRKRRKRNAIGIIIVSILILAGMVIFWK